MTIYYYFAIANSKTASKIDVLAFYANSKTGFITKWELAVMLPNGMVSEELINQGTCVQQGNKYKLKAAQNQDYGTLEFYKPITALKQGDKGTFTDANSGLPRSAQFFQRIEDKQSGFKKMQNLRIA